MSIIFILLFIIKLHSLTSFGVTSFTAPSCYITTSSEYCRAPPQRTVATLYFSSTGNDTDSKDVVKSNVDDIDGMKDDTNEIDRSVTLFERARIISYRVAMSASALCLCVLAVDDIGFLEGSGANIGQLVERSSNVLPIVAGGSLSLCPVPRNKLFEVGTVSLGLATISSSFISNVGDIQQLAGSISWSLSIIALMVVSIREIFYFGVEYKQECIITLLTLALMLDHNNHIPFTFPLCALGMSILAAGKLFEPCKEDLVRSNSEFLAE